MNDLGFKNEYVSDLEKSLRKTVLLVYLLFIAGLFTGPLTPLIGMVLAYIKKNDAAGTIYRSHINWILTICWTVAVRIPLIGLVTAALLFVIDDSGGSRYGSTGNLLMIWFLFMLCIFAGVIVWSMYRIIKGFWRWSEERPVA